MKWVSEGAQLIALEALRWLVSIIFFYLGLTKASLLFKYGIEPYGVIVETAGLPSFIKYYGLIAVVIELFLAIGVWVKGLFRYALGLALVFTVIGAGLSVFFLVFKLKSECGCGLLGDSELELLAQKLAILVALSALHRYGHRLFNQPSKV